MTLGQFAGWKRVLTIHATIHDAISELDRLLMHIENIRRLRLDMDVMFEW
jgi:hypothetical protein